MKPSKGLSFDGKGVNDLDEVYAQRIATFSCQTDGEKFGNLFAAAPDMLALLKDLDFELSKLGYGKRNTELDELAVSVAVQIRKAEGKTND
jgi:hypothetical protein